MVWLTCDTLSFTRLTLEAVAVPAAGVGFQAVCLRTEEPAALELP